MAFHFTYKNYFNPENMTYSRLVFPFTKKKCLRFNLICTVCALFFFTKTAKKSYFADLGIFAGSVRDALKYEFLEEKQVKKKLLG